MRILLAGRIAAVALSITAGSAALATGSSPAPTAINLGNAAYTQNFDTLANTGSGPFTALPAGWQIAENGSGGAADGSYIVGTGSNNAGGAYSFGAAGSSERALGSLTSGTVNPIYLGALFTNATGATITGLSLAYTGELWRRGTGSDDLLSFSYFIGTPTSLASSGWVNVSTLDFLSPETGSGAVDGNTVSTDIASIISGLSIGAGSSFAIRWTDSTVSGSNDGLAIDDLSLTAITATSAVPESGTWVMMVAGFGLLGAALRRRRDTAFA
jgi:hypothetical protein